MHSKRRLPLSAEMLELINRRSVVVSSKECSRDSLHSAADENKLHVATRLSQLQHELLTSEVEYLKQIEKVQTYFMEPLMVSKLLGGDQFEEIFGHLRTIYLINGELVREIKANKNNILNAFNVMAPYFKLYSVYATQYRFCLASLRSAAQCNEQFAKFMQNQESRPEVQCQLSSLLIAPIQRIPRYALMFQQLLVISSKTSDNYPLLLGKLAYLLPAALGAFHCLSEAYHKIVETAKHLDSKVQEHENFESVLQISYAVKDGKSLVIKPGRKLIKHGVLLSNERSKMRERYVILFTDILMKCRMKRKLDVLHQPGSLKCELILPMNKCCIIPGSQNLLAVSCENINVLLDCGSELQKLEWLREIKSAIYSEHGNRSTLHKRHSERRPASGCDLDMYRDFGVSPGHKLRKRRSRLPMQETELNAKENSHPISIKRRHSVSALESLDRGDPNEIASTSTNAKDSLFPLREHVSQAKIAKETFAEQKRRKLVSNVSSPHNKMKLLATIALQTHGTLFKRCEFKPCLLRKRKSIHSSLEVAQDVIAGSEGAPTDIYVFGTSHNTHRFSFAKIISKAADNFKKFFGFR